MTPWLLLDLCWRRAYAGALGNNRGVGGLLEPGPRCQNGSRAAAAHKEGESALIWAGVQSDLDWDGGGQRGGRGVGTRLTEAFILEGDLKRQKDTGTGCIPMQRRRGTQASGIRKRFQGEQQSYSTSFKYRPLDPSSLWLVLMGTISHYKRTFCPQTISISSVRTAGRRGFTF